MDDRRRTISSEEQMIGEALMRVSNTLEAQRLTKSLDYQEKLRTRSNIRLIIAIICLFVAMMMMVISGVLLFVLWRYADPVLDTVVPFLKGMLGDFGIIWDGLVESLTYVPVMVEQLTRLLENVIVMLEGINQIDLAGMMKYLTAMLGAMSGMVVDLAGAVKTMMPMLASMGQSLSNMMNGGLGEFIDSLFGDGFMENMGAIMGGMVQMMADLINVIVPMTNSMVEGMEIAQQNGTMGSIAEETANFFGKVPDTIQAAGGMLETAQGAMESIDPEQAERIVTGLGDAMEGMVNGLSGIAGLLGAIGNIKLPGMS